MEQANKRVVSVKNFPSVYPGAGFTEASIRWLIFNEKTNGFSSCICRVGRKILIDVDKFEKWLDAGGDNQGTKKPSKPSVEVKSAEEWTNENAARLFR